MSELRRDSDHISPDLGPDGVTDQELEEEARLDADPELVYVEGQGYLYPEDAKGLT